MIALFLFLVASVSAHCTEEGKCEQFNFPNTNDETRLRQNSRLRGHVLAEHTSPSSFDCFLRCVDNCQCLSFNYKTNDGSNATNCQLNGAATYTNPEAITPEDTWTYTEIVRSYLEEPLKQSCSPVSCHNGCCQSSPCGNGGTCHQVCDVRARRFLCACPPGYTGHRCHKPLRSCYDILVSGRHENGIYTIVDEANHTLNVYCDFNTEPGAAWTLVQSCSLDKGSRYSENDIFSDKPLFGNFPVNEAFPSDWSSYRLSLADMQFIRAHSTHWRATCDFPTIGVDFRDYVRASLEKNDVMKLGNFECRHFEFINVRGNQCTDCTAITVYKLGRAPYVKSFESKSYLCEFDGRPNAGIQNEKNFGRYNIINSAFRCSATRNSTTQYWFGKL